MAAGKIITYRLRVCQEKNAKKMHKDENPGLCKIFLKKVLTFRENVLYYNQKEGKQKTKKGDKKMTTKKFLEVINGMNERDLLEVMDLFNESSFEGTWSEEFKTKYDQFLDDLWMAWNRGELDY